MNRRLPYVKLLHARRLCQILTIGLFFFLFIKTDYSGSDTMEYAVNILFRLDPLLVTCVMLGTRAFLFVAWPAFLLVGLSLLLGRFFCGWLCPLGGLLDGVSKVFGENKGPENNVFPHFPVLLLWFLLLTAVLGLPLAGYFDPFAILVRGLALGFYPAFNFITYNFFDFTYHHAPAFLNLILEPLYEMMKLTVLPFEQKHYALALLAGGALLGVMGGELYQRRFFCRSLCPLGAYLGLVARFGMLKVTGGTDDCGLCQKCRVTCRMGAINKKREISMAACTLCMDCLVSCPQQIIDISMARKSLISAELSPSRRKILTTLSAGFLLPLLTKVEAGATKRLTSSLIRPPGALLEEDFLQRCVRCGECMQVCIKNSLQPVFLQAGLDGIFTPYLNMRLGYCEYNCTLCGQVCPTGAIRALPIEEKRLFKIGHAWFDHGRCLPYAKNIPCIVCEEHCPTPVKAIGIREVEIDNGAGNIVRLKQPYIRDELCIGCGICETMCPLPGVSAIRITTDGESRDEENVIPTASIGSYGEGY